MNPDSRVGPWPSCEEIVLAGRIVPVVRPKWHATYKFGDGGVFKFWDLVARDKRKTSNQVHICFREKVGFWSGDLSKELPWSVQDRICFMLKHDKQDEHLAAMEEETMCVQAASPMLVLWWIVGHPEETCLDVGVWGATESLLKMLDQQKEQYGRIQETDG